MVRFKSEKITRFIMSLSLAVFIWMYVTNMNNPIQSKTFASVPVRYINIADVEAQKLAVNSDKIPTTSVTIEGRYSNIVDANASDLVATVDFKDLALKEGVNNVALCVETTDKNIRIVEEKTLTQVKVDVEKLVQKEFDVVVNTVGEVDAQYVNLEPIVSNQKVVCSGTKSTIENIRTVIATADLTNATSDIKKTVSLVPLNKYGEKIEHISLKDTSATVSIPVKFKKEVPIIINISSYPKNGYALKEYALDKKSMLIIGDKSLLESVASVSTEQVDLSQSVYDFEKRLRIELPADVLTKDSNTIFVSFKIEK